MKKETANSMLRTAGFMAVATMLAKIFGLVRDSMIGAYFSTGIEADAFMTASKLPTTLFDIVIGGVISATFIPVFNSIMARDNKKEAMEFVNKFVTMILLITTLIAVFGIVFADPLVQLLAPEFSGDKHALAVQLTSIMFPMIIFTGLAFSFVGLLQSFGEYNIPSVISLVSNLAIILYFVLFGKKFGVQGLAVTMVIAWSLQLLIQVPSLHKLKVRYRPDFRLKDPNIKKAMLLAGPMLVSTWVQPLYSIINSRLASGINGAVSTLEYANRLYIIVVGVFSFVVTNLIFPKLSRANANNNEREAHQLIVTSLKAVLLVILPLMAGFMILSKPITSIIYEHGIFTQEDVLRVSSVLTCYSVGMVGLAVNEILSKSFFSMQDSKTPMRNSILSMVANIILAYVLFHFFQTNGLALAAAGGSVVNALLNYICISRRYPSMFGKKDFVDLVKMVFSAGVMAVVVWGLYRALGNVLPQTFVGNILLGGGCALGGIVVYGLVCYLVRVEQIRALVSNLRKK